MNRIRRLYLVTAFICLFVTWAVPALSAGSSPGEFIKDIANGSAAVDPNGFGCRANHWALGAFGDSDTGSFGGGSGALDRACNPPPPPPPPPPTPPQPQNLPKVSWHYHNTGETNVFICAAVAVFDGANAGQTYGRGTVTFDGVPVGYMSNDAAWGRGRQPDRDAGCSGTVPNPDYVPPAPSPPSSPPGGTSGGNPDANPFGNPSSPDSGGGGGGGGGTPPAPPNKKDPTKAPNRDADKCPTLDAQENPITHFWSVFSSHFPVDMLSLTGLDAGASASGDCSQLHFFTFTGSFCLLRDIASILKYLIWLAFLLKAILAL